MSHDSSPFKGNDYQQPGRVWLQTGPQGFLLDDFQNGDKSFRKVEKTLGTRLWITAISWEEELKIPLEDAL